MILHQLAVLTRPALRAEGWPSSCITSTRPEGALPFNQFVKNRQRVSGGTARFGGDGEILNHLLVKRRERRCGCDPESHKGKNNQFGHLHLIAHHLRLNTFQ
jgi:hypothetical protein